MRIAIVGTGISGLSAAWLLAEGNELTLFEANDYIGGHTNTVRVKEGQQSIPVDTGFIVFNQQNYPNLCRLFDRLQIPSRDSDMSFSVKCEASGLEYKGSSLRTLFTQKRNIFKPAFLRMLKDILTLHRRAPKHLANGLDEAITVADYARQHGYSEYFMNNYLLPLGASLWSCPPAAFKHFPMRFVLEFLNNHGMLQINNRPVWKTVAGGANTYIKKLIPPFASRIFVKSPVKQVIRHDNRVTVRLISGKQEEFDEVIMACHADQSLRLIADPDEAEKHLLSAFNYQYNEAILHTDSTILPKQKPAWASWNYRIPTRHQGNTQVSYNMNMLQGIESTHTYCVSLNQADAIRTDRIIKKIGYHHPVFTPGRDAAQSQHEQLIRRKRISYCGAYWGYGFHEDGINSGLAVAAAFDRVMG